MLMIASKGKIPILLAPRGELCKNAFHKKYKKIPYIMALKLLFKQCNIYYQATSNEEIQAIIKYLGAKEEHIYLLSNVPSLPSHNFIQNMKKIGYARCVFISRIHPKKNLTYALKILKDVECNVIFDIYGPLEDVSYWKECLSIIDSLPNNIAVKYCGVVSHDQIAETFAKYDVLLFPTQSENYGHVIVEALLSGCILVISDQTPWTDVNDTKAGWAISLDDSERFITAINEIGKMDDKQFEILKKRSIAYISSKTSIQNLENDYLSVLKRITKC
jgi:glycosyltransferase involved in cell wall biosynthesis